MSTPPLKFLVLEATCERCETIRGQVARILWVVTCPGCGKRVLAKPVGRAAHEAPFRVLAWDLSAPEFRRSKKTYGPPGAKSGR